MTRKHHAAHHPLEGLAVLDDPWLRIVNRWEAPKPHRVDMTSAYRAFASARVALLFDLNAAAAAAALSEVKRTA